MIVGVMMYGPVATGGMDTDKLVAGLKNIGINHVEPCVSLDGKMGLPVFWTMDEYDSYDKVIKEAGLQVISCHVKAEDYLAELPAMCQLVDKYNIKQLVVSMPEPTEVAIQERAFVYRQVADVLKEHGAELLLHNNKSSIQTKVNGITAYEYMIKTCLGKVYMQLDTGWAARGGVDPIDIIRRNEDMIKSLHFKDFDMSFDTDVDTCIGDGTLDNEMYMQFARAKGIPLLIDSDTYGDICADIQKSYNYLMYIGQERAHSVSYLNIYDTETGKVEILERFEGVIEAPNWIGSGNYLIYNSEGHIYKFDLATKESTLIDSGIADRCNNDHVVSSDEKSIAVSSDYETEQGSGSRIFILPIEGGEARLVTPNAPSYLHGWSPDGRELAYCAFRNVAGKQAVDIYTIPAEGGEEKRLTSEGFNDGPEYSPDGKHIWFISTRTGLMQVYRMNCDGSDIQQMTFEDRNNWFGHVSPDCKKVVNLAYRVGDSHPGEHLPNMQVELWLMDYDGAGRKKILEFFGGQGSINVNSWSPDSRYFAFVSYDISFES